MSHSLTAEKQALDFVEKSLGIELKRELGFYLLFRDGILLCQLINKFQPNAIPKISAKEFPFLQIENINMFLLACQNYGVDFAHMFDAFDFYNGQCTDKTIATILALKKQIETGTKYQPVLLQRLSTMSLNSPIKSQNINRSETNLGSRTVSVASSLTLTDIDGDTDQLTNNDKVNEQNLNAVVTFLENSLNDALPTRDLYACLKDGVVLCRVMNSLNPNSIPSISTRKHPYQQLQNIHFFLTAAKRFGLRPNELFQPTDLFEGRDMQQVIITIMALSKLAKNKTKKISDTVKPKVSPTKRESRASSYNLSSQIPNDIQTSKPSRVNFERRVSKPRISVTTCQPQQTRGLKLVIPDSKAVNTVNEYMLGDCIGKGQFAAVYRGMNVSTGEILAIKRIPLNNNTTSREMATMMKEVDLLKSLSHQNVVRYDGFMQQEGFLNIVMEYIEIGSLWNVMKQFGGSFTENLVMNFTHGILQGLAYLHGKNVIHCDLKSANILITKEAVVKLSDFGMSREFSFEMDTANAVGTPNFLAPEVIELKGASTASDIWSVGCTAIELITGKPPYNDFNPMTVLFKIVEEEMIIPDSISLPMKDFLKCCFHRNPEKRPSARMLLHHNWMKLLAKQQTQQLNQNPYMTPNAMETSYFNRSLSSINNNAAQDGLNLSRRETHASMSKRKVSSSNSQASLAPTLSSHTTTVEQRKTSTTNGEHREVLNFGTARKKKNKDSCKVLFVSERQEVKSTDKPNNDDSSSLFYQQLTATTPQSPPQSQKQTFFCSDCQQHFQIDRNDSTTELDHYKSIAHQVAMGDCISKPPSYGIPIKNKGFQILQGSGWNYGSGLGVDEQGRMYPVSGRLKLDRTGLGGEGKTRSVKSSSPSSNSSSRSSSSAGGQKRKKKELDSEYKREQESKKKMLAYMHERPHPN